MRAVPVCRACDRASREARLSAAHGAAALVAPGTTRCPGRQVAAWCGGTSRCPLRAWPSGGQDAAAPPRPAPPRVGHAIGGARAARAAAQDGTPGEGNAGGARERTVRRAGCPARRPAAAAQFWPAGPPPIPPLFPPPSSACLGQVHKLGLVILAPLSQRTATVELRAAAIAAALGERADLSMGSYRGGEADDAAADLLPASRSVSPRQLQRKGRRAVSLILMSLSRCRTAAWRDTANRGVPPSLHRPPDDPVLTGGGGGNGRLSPRRLRDGLKGVLAGGDSIQRFQLPTTNIVANRNRPAAGGEWTQMVAQGGQSGGRSPDRLLQMRERRRARSAPPPQSSGWHIARTRYYNSNMGGMGVQTGGAGRRGVHDWSQWRRVCCHGGGHWRRR